MLYACASGVGQGTEIGEGSMKKIFVSHPYEGKRSNTIAISDICRKLVSLGVIPISPVHMFGFLDDGLLDERKLAMEFCKKIIPDIDELKANDLSKVREIWLLHLSDGNSDAERFKREVMELTGKPVYIALEKGEIDTYSL